MSDFATPRYLLMVGVICLPFVIVLMFGEPDALQPQATNVAASSPEAAEQHAAAKEKVPQRQIGKPAPMQKTTPHPLTGHIKDVLGIDNVAMVIALDIDGTPHVFFEGRDYVQPTYPVDTSQLSFAYGTTMLGFQGSHCIDFIDTLGYRRRVCTEQH